MVIILVKGNNLLNHRSVNKHGRKQIRDIQRHSIDFLFLGGGEMESLKLYNWLAEQAT